MPFRAANAKAHGHRCWLLVLQEARQKRPRKKPVPECLPESLPSQPKVCMNCPKIAHSYLIYYSDTNFGPITCEYLILSFHANISTLSVLQVSRSQNSYSRQTFSPHLHAAKPSMGNKNGGQALPSSRLVASWHRSALLGFALLPEAVVLANHGSALFGSHLACMQTDPMCKAYFSCRLGHGLSWTILYEISCLQGLIYQGLPLPLAHLYSLAKHAALCGFLYVIPILLVCFDPPLERYRYSRLFNS